MSKTSGNVVPVDFVRRERPPAKTAVPEPARNPNGWHFTKRGRWAIAAVASVAVGATAWFVPGANAPLRTFFRHVAIDADMGPYSEPDLYTKMCHDGRLPSPDKLVYRVQELDNPTTIANTLGAYDSYATAYEASAQAGGDKKLHAGELLVFPLRGFDPSNALVKVLRAQPAGDCSDASGS